jgi:tetratricopeptide (TPR) repeat protein
VRENPGSAEAWGRLGEVYDVHRLNDQAVECYDRAIDLDPAAWRWDYFAGLNLSGTDRAEAGRRFERALEHEARYPPLWLHAGWTRLLDERLDDAAIAFERLLVLEPSSVNARIGLARVALASNDAERALGHLDEAARVAPGAPGIHRLRARAFRLRGDDARALEAERLGGTEAAAAAPLGDLLPYPDPMREEMTLREGVSARWLRDNTVRLLAQGRAEEALERLERALEVDPDSAVAMAETARVLEQLGRTDEAIAFLDRAHALDPSNASTWARRGRLLAARGDDNDAIASFRQALDLDARHVGARVEMALALARGGHWAPAVQELELALNHAPTSADIMAELAWILATCPDDTVRQPRRATELARALCERTAYQDIGYMNILAAAQASAREYGLAADTARRALTLIRDAPADTPDELRPRMEQMERDLVERLGLYESGRPYVAGRAGT